MYAIRSYYAFEQHAETILEIFNDAILNSTALYDYKPRTPQSMVGWFDAKRAGRFVITSYSIHYTKLYEYFPKRIGPQMLR